MTAIVDPNSGRLLVPHGYDFRSFDANFANTVDREFLGAWPATPRFATYLLESQRPQVFKIFSLSIMRVSCTSPLLVGRLG